MNDLKNKVRFTSTLPIELRKKLNEYSKISMIPISKIIEASLTEYLNNKESTGI